MTIDPKSLTAEERAIVDAVVLKSLPTFAPDWSYPLAIATCAPIILARRALFAPAKEEEVTCPNCKQAATESHYHGNLTGEGGWWICPGFAAVRAQASQPQAVKMGKVDLSMTRCAVEHLKAHSEPNCQGGGGMPALYKMAKEAIAELDAVEGR